MRDRELRYTLCPDGAAQIADFDFQNIPEQEQEGVICLILCRSGNLLVDGQMRQELPDIFSAWCFSKKPAFHSAGVIEKAPCPIHISPFRTKRVVFHTDGLPDVYHDQILVERSERRFCVVVINPGRFSTVKMIAVELNGLFGLLYLLVGNVFPGL